MNLTSPMLRYNRGKDMIYKKRRNVGILLLLISIVFIIYGAMRGEMDTVLGKAIKLCLECIGIG